VRGHHFGDDRQSEAGASAAAGSIRVESHEALEYACPVFARNTRAVVTDGDDRFSIPVTDEDLDT
jgi:hypothetical protein